MTVIERCRFSLAGDRDNRLARTARPYRHLQEKPGCGEADCQLNARAQAMARRWLGVVHQGRDAIVCGKMVVVCKCEGFCYPWSGNHFFSLQSPSRSALRQGVAFGPLFDAAAAGRREDRIESTVLPIPLGKCECRRGSAGAGRRPTRSAKFADRGGRPIGSPLQVQQTRRARPSTRIRVSGGRCRPRAPAPRPRPALSSRGLRRYGQRTSPYRGWSSPLLRFSWTP